MLVVVVVSESLVWKVRDQWLCITENCLIKYEPYIVPLCIDAGVN